MTSSEKGVAGARSGGGGSANGDRIDDPFREDVDLGCRDQRDVHGPLCDPGDDEVSEIGRRTNTGRRPVTSRDPSDCVAQGASRPAPATAMVRSFEAWVAEHGRRKDPRHVVHRDRADRLVAQAHEPEYGERVERMTEVVEHVVAPAMDDARLEDRVVEAGLRIAPRRPTSSGGMSSGRPVGRAGSSA